MTARRWVSRLALFGGLGLVGLVGVARLGFAPAARPPVLEIDEAHRSIGGVVPGRTQPIAFRIRNVGEHVLKIDDLKPSCGCSPGVLDRSSIPPGETATLTIHFRGPVELGPFAHSIAFKTNDPNCPVAAVNFSGRASWPIEVEPKQLRFQLRSEDQQAAAMLELFTTDGGPLDIRSAAADAPWIRVEESIDALGSHRRRYRVVVAAHAEDAATSGMIQFKTGNHDRPVILVPVVYGTAPRAPISPARLMLRPTAPGTRLPAKFILGGVPDSAIVAVEAVHEGWLVTDWNTKPIDGDRVRCNVEVQVPGSLGYSRSAIRFHRGGASDYSEAEVSVLVRRTDDD